MDAYKKNLYSRKLFDGMKVIIDKMAQWKMQEEQNTGRAPKDIFVMDAIGNILLKQFNHVRYNSA